MRSDDDGRCEEVVNSSRKKGVIKFNPKYSHADCSGNSSKIERGTHVPSSNSPTAFSKPRKYFDSADFFMREELKPKESDAGSERPSQSSCLGSECQSCSSGSTDSPDGMNRNIVPLILLRRSKSSALISSSDGTDMDQESLPTTVEALNGSNRNTRPARSSSTESSQVVFQNNEPSMRMSLAEKSEPTSQEGSEHLPRYHRTPHDIRMLLLPRFRRHHSPHGSSLAGTVSTVSPTRVKSPFKPNP